MSKRVCPQDTKLTIPCKHTSRLYFRQILHIFYQKLTRCNGMLHLSLLSISNNH